MLPLQLASVDALMLLDERRTNLAQARARAALSWMSWAAVSYTASPSADCGPGDSGWNESPSGGHEQAGTE